MTINQRQPLIRLSDLTYAVDSPLPNCPRGCGDTISNDRARGFGWLSCSDCGMLVGPDEACWMACETEACDKCGDIPPTCHCQDDETPDSRESLGLEGRG